MWGAGPGAAWRDGAGLKKEAPAGTRAWERWLGEVVGRGAGTCCGDPGAPRTRAAPAAPGCGGRAYERGDTDSGGTRGARRREPSAACCRGGL